MISIRTRNFAIAVIANVATILLAIVITGRYEDIQAQSDVYGVIRQSGETVSRLNIAVSDFKMDRRPQSKGEDTLTYQLKRSIEKGLEFSLYFNVVSNDSSLTSLIGKRDFNYDDWIYLGAEHLIGGTFHTDGKQFGLDLEISDVPRGKVIYRDDLKSSQESIKELSFKVVDRIIYILTGEQGIARSKIIFSFVKGIGKELAICNWDGSRLITLTNNNSLNLFPTASPSGQEIYFTSYIRGNPDLYKLDLFSRSISPISARKGINSSAAVSPDGKYIALILSVDSDAELYLLDRNGKMVRRISKSWGIESSPAFSPSGKEIVFSSDRSGAIQLYITDIEGLNQRRLTYNGNYNDTPSWSPKGDLITYASREGGRFQIYTIPITGENPQRLTSLGNNQDPCFSPDGLHICFVSDRSGSNEIYIMNFDGSLQDKISSVKNAYNPCWVPSSDKD